MYRLIYGRDIYNTFTHYTVLYWGTLEACAKERRASGDLVFDANGNIVQDDSWLFAWEKVDPNCYARKCMASKVTLGGVCLNSN